MTVRRRLAFARYDKVDSVPFSRAASRGADIPLIGYEDAPSERHQRRRERLFKYNAVVAIGRCKKECDGTPVTVRDDAALTSEAPTMNRTGPGLRAAGRGFDQAGVHDKSRLTRTFRAQLSFAFPSRADRKIVFPQLAPDASLTQHLEPPMNRARRAINRRQSCPGAARAQAVQDATQYHPKGCPWPASRIRSRHGLGD